jgi:hypothetical protein
LNHDTYATAQAAGKGVPMGLSGIISTSNPYVGITSSYFQNIDRTAAGKGWAKATVVHADGAGSTLTPLSNVKLLEGVQEQEKWGRAKVLISNLHIWRAFYQTLETDRTLKPEPALWGGLTGITFYAGRSGSIPFIYDEDAPDNKVFSPDDDYLSNYAPSKNGMAWLPGDNGILTRIHGKDESTASLVFYYNFGCEKTKAQMMIDYVKHSAS